MTKALAITLTFIALSIGVFALATLWLSFTYLELVTPLDFPNGRGGLFIVEMLIVLLIQDMWARGRFDGEGDDNDDA